MSELGRGKNQPTLSQALTRQALSALGQAFLTGCHNTLPLSSPNLVTPVTDFIDQLVRGSVGGGLAFFPASWRCALTTQVKLSRIAIRKILLATDFSLESQNAFKCAISLAKRYESKLFLTHAISEEASLTAGDAWPGLIDVARRNAEKSMVEIEQTQELQSLPHEVVMRSGETWDVLSRVVSYQNIDLIVMGTHGGGGIDITASAGEICIGRQRRHRASPCRPRRISRTHRVAMPDRPTEPPETH